MTKCKRITVRLVYESSIITTIDISDGKEYSMDDIYQIARDKVLFAKKNQFKIGDEVSQEVIRTQVVEDGQPMDEVLSKIENERNEMELEEEMIDNEDDDFAIV